MDQKLPPRMTARSPMDQKLPPRMTACCT
uniref:Uncharacterized protein n=1 Tax=Arundo donax TaxID=35708 RepID=A0A0A9FJ33_ARUDO